MAGRKGRSLAVSPQKLKLVDEALKKFGSQADLAAQLRISRTTVNKFCTCTLVSRAKFHQICKKLELDWREIAGLPKDAELETEEKKQDTNEIDALVQEVRSLQLSQSKIAEAKKALKSICSEIKAKYKLTNEFSSEQDQMRLLARYMSLSDSPKNSPGDKQQLQQHFRLEKMKPEEWKLIRQFFEPEPIKDDDFRKICSKLQLEWRHILDINVLEVCALVQRVRKQRHEKIQHQCGTMRMLDISQPVDLADIYTDVNILEEITSQQPLEIRELLQNFNPEADNFDRLGLGRVSQKRVPGLHAVKRYSKLVVLGKPGAGKTTFLQWIAMQCNLGEFQKNRVPIFIGLKNFAEDTRRDDSESRFLNYISEEFASCGIVDKSVIETILTQGLGLILLDSLDEVSQEDEEEVITQIRRFADKYFKNQFIITCRIAAQKYRFEKFTYIEVADFNDQQVEAFAKKWFIKVARKNQEDGEATTRRFIEKLHLPENQQIRELAVTPILLNLTCLVFQAKGEFPSRRSKLYEQGLDILLVKWDESRGIKRDEVYRYLSLEQKIELLSQVAAITFEKSRYFFEQGEVEQCIANYLSTLPNARTNRSTVQSDSRAILKSIEAQHGLFVERAQGIYSLSHLTFQEYFTARAFINSFSSKESEKFFSYIHKKSWREVFLLAVAMTSNADELLLSMKPKTDSIIPSTNVDLQNLLFKINQKVSSFHDSRNSTAIRAFYLSIYCSLDQQLRLVEILDIDLFKFETALAKCQDYARILNQRIKQDPEFQSTLDDFYNFKENINKASCYAKEDEFISKFSLLKNIIDDMHIPNIHNFANWWQENGQVWTEELQKLINEHRDFTHDLPFSQQNQDLLQQYYNANLVLVECLTSGCKVSPEVRQGIEDTLLLPIAEIEKRQQQIL